MTDEQEKSERQLIELLNELRVALPGVQILFAFLLAVPFQMRFAKVTPTQRDLYFATLLATALSTIFLIAPSATHRVRFHKRDREYLIETGNTYLLIGLGFLAIAIVLALILISDVLYNGVVVWLAPALVGALLVAVWFVRPLLRRGSSGP
jgi:hypothetical protein